MHRFHELLQLCEELGVETSQAEASIVKEPSDPTDDLESLGDSKPVGGEEIVFSFFFFFLNIET